MLYAVTKIECWPKTLNQHKFLLLRVATVKARSSDFESTQNRSFESKL